MLCSHKRQFYQFVYFIADSHTSKDQQNQRFHDDPRSTQLDCDAKQILMNKDNI